MTSKNTAPQGWNFLVVGCGSIGKRHLGNLLELGVKNAFAVDVNEAHLKDVKETFGVSTFCSLDEALEHKMDVALICTPTHLHHQQALRALEANCHLFIEKPISHTLDGLDDLIAEAERRQRHTLVGCNLRFHPGLKKVKALLDEGAIGKVISLRAQFGQYLPDWHPWEDYRLSYSAHKEQGGGVVLDCIHEFDYVCWLLGKVQSVTSVMGKLSSLDINTEDVAEILLVMQSGAHASIHLDYVRRDYNRSLEIIGEQGTIQLQFQNNTLRWFTPNRKLWQSRHWPGVTTNSMYLEEMSHFLNVLSGAERPQLNASQARDVLAVALTAKQAARNYQSIRTQKAIP